MEMHLTVGPRWVECNRTVIHPLCEVLPHGNSRKLAPEKGDGVL